MDRKEEWIEGTLNSMENMRRAGLSSGLYEQLLTNSRVGLNSIAVSNKTIWRAAAGIALLIMLNVLSIVNWNNGVSKPKHNNAFVQEYFSYVNEVQL